MSDETKDACPDCGKGESEGLTALDFFRRYGGVWTLCATCLRSPLPGTDPDGR